MDKVIQGLLSESSENFQLEKLPESDQFEHFAAYLAVRRHYGDASFDISDLITGSGGDGGLDAAAVIINGSLVTDVDDVKEMAKSGKLAYLFRIGTS